MINLTIPANLKYEASLWKTGVNVVAGVDEVGRGCLAGPIVAAAVAWPKEILEWSSNENHPFNKFLSKIKDSKKVTEKNRNILSEFIKENCLHYSIIEISAEQIDIAGIAVCNVQALEDASLQIKDLNHVLADHHKIFVDQKVSSTSITKGETHSISIAAASIIAKVYRDNLMKSEYHTLYPEYGFDTHVGYGTAKHISIIKSLGVTPIHRKTFLSKLIIN